MIGFPKMLWIINNRVYRSGTSSILLLKEKLRSLFIGLAFKPFSPFYEILNEKIFRMVSAGLIDYWMNRSMNPRGSTAFDENVGPQVLTMEHLAIGFKVCLVPLAISLTVFFFEMGRKYLIKEKFGEK